MQFYAITEPDPAKAHNQSWVQTNPQNLLTNFVSYLTFWLKSLKGSPQRIERGTHTVDRCVNPFA